MCGSECLNVEKVAPFDNIFEISFPFGIEFDIVGTMQLGIKVEPLLRVCGIAHYTS